MGIPDHLTCLLKNLYAGQEATVRTGHGTTEMEGENVTDLTDTSEIETAKCGDQMDMEDIKVGS